MKTETLQMREQRANNVKCKGRVYLQPEFFFFFTTSFFVSAGGTVGRKETSVTTRGQTA